MYSQQGRSRRKSPAIALLHFIMAREFSEKRDDDDEIRIRIPAHIFATLPLENKNKMVAKKITGRKAGKSNYSHSEIMNLLSVLQRVLPIGPEEWQQCADEHSVSFPLGRRCKDSIRRKFSDLYRKGIPTGDPNCPEDVKLAKRIKWAIGDRAAIGDGEEEFNLADTSFTSSQPDPDAPPVADPLLEDDSDDDDEPVVLAPVVPAAPPPARPRPLAPVKRSYTTSRGGKDELKQDFLELYQTNMLAQQQERAEERRQAAEERRQANQRSEQMMAMMMAMISGMTGRTDTRPAPLIKDGSDDSTPVDSDDDSTVSANTVTTKKKSASAPIAGVVTRHHKKRRGLGVPP